MSTSELEKKLDRIERKLSLLLQDNRKPKETWVKVGTIIALTGWDREKLRRARLNQIIKHKVDESNRHWYLLESLPEVYKKQTA